MPHDLRTDPARPARSARPALPLLPAAAVDALRRGVGGTVTYPADPAYAALVARAPWPTGRPSVVVSARSEADVTAVLGVASVHGLVVGVRSTAPDDETRPSVLVLTEALDSVVVRPEQLCATVGVGADWAELHAAAGRHHLRPTGSSPPSGPVAAVLDDPVAADRVVEVHVVGPDGFVRTTSADEARTGPGVLTSVVLRLAPAEAADALAGQAS